MSLILLATGLLASAQSVSTAPSSDAVAWGDPVQGIQLQLAVMNNQPGSDGWPSLGAKVHNLGTGTVHFDPCQPFEIEIDGNRYTPTEVISVAVCAPYVAATGEQSRNFAARWAGVYNFGLNGNGKDILSSNKTIGFGDLGIKAGKHSIRIRMSVHNVTSDTSEQETIKLESNAITIQIPFSE